MALRVLLADESSTIKKVFQLALQDYAVEVRPVNLGVDVVSVAHKFKPDIIFADILLQKKNGYETCVELKKESELKNIPVVLMWSGFMELDEDKYTACGANSHLEKPFDVAALRKIINELVPKTKTQRLSRYLNFPKLPEFEEQARPASAGAPQDGPAKGAEDWNMDQFEPLEAPVYSDEDDFKEVSLPSAPAPEEEFVPGNKAQGPRFFKKDEETEEEQNDWAQQDLSKFRLNLGEDNTSENDLPVDYLIPDEKIEADQVISDISQSRSLISSAPASQTEASQDMDSDLEVEFPRDSGYDSNAEIEVDLSTLSRHSPQSSQSQSVIQSSFSKDEMEEILRSEARKVIEEICWKVVPELAERMLEREIQALLKDAEAEV